MRIAAFVLLAIAGLNLVFIMFESEPVGDDRAFGVVLFAAIGVGLLAWDRHRGKRRAIIDAAMVAIERGEDLNVPALAAQTGVPATEVSKHIYAAKRQGSIPPDAKVDHKRQGADAPTS